MECFNVNDWIRTDDDVFIELHDSFAYPVNLTPSGGYFLNPNAFAICMVPYGIVIDAGASWPVPESLQCPVHFKRVEGGDRDREREQDKNLEIA